MQRFFKNGDTGKEVHQIQSQLHDLGFKCAVDGSFGNETRKHIMSFQIKAKLNADGVVGPQTWKALGLPSFVTPINPQKIPSGKVEIINMFGDPLEPGYWKEYGGFCATPPELDHVFPYMFAGEHGFWCNKLMVATFQKVYRSIVRAGLADELQTFNGCFNIRNIRGGRDLSTHSWGIAVDHNSATNMLGHQPKIHSGIVGCFKQYGFIWGGDFGRKDGMHFQYAIRY